MSLTHTPPGTAPTNQLTDAATAANLTPPAEEGPSGTREQLAPAAGRNQSGATETFAAEFRNVRLSTFWKNRPKL